MQQWDGNALWDRFPALFYGCVLLLGWGWFLWGHPCLSFPTAALFLPILSIKRPLRILLGLFLLLAIQLGGKAYYTFPTTPHSGMATIAPEVVTYSERTQRWHYRAKLLSLTTSITVAKNIPITFSLKKPLSMASIYTVHGTLIPPNRWISKNKWETVAKQLPIGKWRFITKHAIKQWIHSSYPSERVYQLLSGLATGEFDDRELSFHFARFGLQHLMAISGFHFGILAYFLQRFLSLFLTWRQSSYAATLVLSLYCLFLGRYPSVIRAWIAISLCLTGLLLHKRSSALNALGLGLLVLMLYDPLSCRSLGFQFSFAVTASILCFYRPMEQLTCHLLPRRSWYATKQLSTSDQLLCPLLNFLRSGIALGLSVYLVALPMTLCFFHTIPLLSFIYNLFMPFCISVSLFLLLLSWLPGITSLNSSITDWILGLAYHVPTIYDFSFHCTSITPPILILYLTLLYAYALHKKSNNNLIMQI